MPAFDLVLCVPTQLRHNHGGQLGGSSFVAEDHPTPTFPGQEHHGHSPASVDPNGFPVPILGRAQVARVTGVPTRLAHLLVPRVFLFASCLVFFKTEGSLFFRKEGSTFCTH